MSRSSGTRRRATLAASFVVTVSAGACTQTKYGPNPPGVAVDPDAGASAPAASAPAATAPSASAGDDGVAPWRNPDGGRRVIANPPRLMPAPPGGYLDKRDDGTCWWSEQKPCPPNAKCEGVNPRRVQCPD
jgi:hypothetical protein